VVMHAVMASETQSPSPLQTPQVVGQGAEMLLVTQKITNRVLPAAIYSNNDCCCYHCGCPCMLNLICTSTCRSKMVVAAILKIGISQYPNLFGQFWWKFAHIGLLA